MIEPQIFHEEEKRLANLASYSVLDSLEEEDYDNLTAIAAEICGTPISLISLIDDKRQWFKSHHGLDATETPKEYAFCAHAINEPNEVFVVQDSRVDERFHDNPLVVDEPRVIFYAGVPLKSDNGLPLGTLCVIDHQPKQLEKHQLDALNSLSNQVMRLLELRRSKKNLESITKKLEIKNGELENFATVAAHDIKSPLMNVNLLANMFLQEQKGKMAEDELQPIYQISKSSERLKNLVKGLLDFSRSEKLLKEDKTEITLKESIEGISELYRTNNNCKFNLDSSIENCICNKTAFEQIMINLIGNAVKYNDKPITKIDIKVYEDHEYYHFEVMDNGPGIPEQFQEKIFKIFEVAAHKDRFGNQGNGIGLATVNKLITEMGGELGVKSTEGEGSRFFFTLPKSTQYTYSDLN